MLVITNAETNIEDDLQEIKKTLFSELDQGRDSQPHEFNDRNIRK